MKIKNNTSIFSKLYFLIFTFLFLSFSLCGCSQLKKYVNEASKKIEVKDIEDYTDEKGRKIFKFNKLEDISKKVDSFDTLYLAQTKCDLYNSFFTGKCEFYIDGDASQYNPYDEDYKYCYLYKGEIKNNKPHGVGMLLSIQRDYIYETGNFYPCTYYIGEFKKGKPTGYGIKFNTPDYVQIDEYSTEYYDSLLEKYSDLLDGDTITTELEDKIVKELIDLANYPIYAGEFESGIYEGKGNYYDHPHFTLHGAEDLFPLECVYICTGEFKKGKMNGYGTEYDDKGNIVYQGKWKNDEYAE